MTAMEDLLHAALAAPEEKRALALSILRDDARIDGARASWPEPYLTLRETARRLGVSACSLWRWKVPGHEIGGRRRFRLCEVVAYLEAKSRSPLHPAPSSLLPADVRQASSANNKQ